MTQRNHPVKRLDQMLSNLGYCSRKEAAKWVKNGWISVNGTIVKDVSIKADPHAVMLDDKPLDHPDDIFIVLNKPVGYVCSHDPSEGKRIYDLLPAQWTNRTPQVVSIGRLDKETSGIIIVTDILPLVHYFATPKNEIKKVYEVTVEKRLSPDLIALFACGTIVLDKEEEPCLPALLEIISDNTCRVTLTEGRYHQVRRMFASVGNTVVSLHRSRFGDYTLENLGPGEFREDENIPEVK